VRPTGNPQSIEHSENRVAGSANRKSRNSAAVKQIPLARRAVVRAEKFIPQL
jgi:hypothetical protein